MTKRHVYTGNHEARLARLVRGFRIELDVIADGGSRHRAHAIQAAYRRLVDEAYSPKRQGGH